MSEQSILGLASAHFHAVTDGREIPDYGRWQHWAGAMRKVIDSFTSDEEVLRYAQDHRNLPFSHREEANLQLIQDCTRIICSEFPWFEHRLARMTDNPRSLPKTLANAGDGKFSNMFLWHVYSLFTCQSHVSDIRTVLEIGGGDGAMARLWCLYFPVERYVIVDLPESLFFSEVCLRAEFGDAVGYCTDSAPPDAKILLVPAERLDSVVWPSDLVINIGSMQEMNDAWIDRYMNWLDRYQTNYFYSLNYAGQPIKELGESRCWWGPRPSVQWTTDLLELDPAVIRIMCPTRHFLQALYRRFPCQGSLDNWSVFRGRALTLSTFLEGLDLVRQKPTPANIELFMETVVRGKTPLSQELLPKEMVALANMVDCEASRAVKQYLTQWPTKLVE